MPISTKMIVRVAQADVALHMAFPNSVEHWHREHDDQHLWQNRPAECDALLVGRDDRVIIDGNCSNRVSAPEGGIIHIHGDLLATLDIAGHYEVVITGNVGPNAIIDAAGFCHIFVGGRFAGLLQSTGSAKVWIDSDFDGILKTGNPSTEVYIAGNLNGDIVPRETASLLSLTVAGFAADKYLTKIANCGYTQFNGAIAQSDVTPGIYPLSGHRKTASGRNSFNRWCVEKEKRTKTKRNAVESH